MPPLYAFPYDAQVWIPTALDPANRSQDFAVFARMRGGVTLARARAALQDAAALVRRRYADVPPTFGFEVMSIQENLTGNQTGTLRALTTMSCARHGWPNPHFSLSNTVWRAS